jgi:hypothetical protein
MLQMVVVEMVVRGLRRQNFLIKLFVTVSFLRVEKVVRAVRVVQAQTLKMDVAVVRGAGKMVITMGVTGAMVLSSFVC